MLALAVIVATALADDAVASLEIAADTNCPTPDAVRTQLQPLAPRVWPPEAAVKSVLLAAAKDPRTDRESLVVTLFGNGHELLEERRLNLYPGCEERARAVAVVIASWLTALPPAAPPTVRLPAPAALTVGRAAPPARSGRGLAIKAAAAALAALERDGVAPGVMLEAELAPADARWSGSLAGLLEGTHRTAIGDGQATWWRWGGAAGAGWQALRGRVWLDLRAALLVTRLHIGGAGFTNNAGGTTFDLGAAVGARLGYAWSHVQPWLGAWAVGWGGTQNVHLVGDAPRGEIPRLQALFGVGATFSAGAATF